jgi:hypothetical protein
LDDDKLEYEIPQDVSMDIVSTDIVGSSNSIVLDNSDDDVTSVQFTVSSEVEESSARSVEDDVDNKQGIHNDFNLSLNKRPRLSSSSSSSSSNLPPKHDSLIINNEIDQPLIAKNFPDAAAYEEEENQELEEDHMVQCNECSRWVHALCEV